MAHDTAPSRLRSASRREERSPHGAPRGPELLRDELEEAAWGTRQGRYAAAEYSQVTHEVAPRSRFWIQREERSLPATSRESDLSQECSQVAPSRSRCGSRHLSCRSFHAQAPELPLHDDNAEVFCDVPQSANFSRHSRHSAAECSEEPVLASGHSRCGIRQESVHEVELWSDDDLEDPDETLRDFQAREAADAIWRGMLRLPKVVVSPAKARAKGATLSGHYCTSSCRAQACWSRGQRRRGSAASGEQRAEGRGRAATSFSWGAATPQLSKPTLTSCSSARSLGRRLQCGEQHVEGRARAAANSSTQTAVASQTSSRIRSCSSSRSLGRPLRGEEQPGEGRLPAAANAVTQAAAASQLSKPAVPPCRSARSLARPQRYCEQHVEKRTPTAASCSAQGLAAAQFSKPAVQPAMQPSSSAKNLAAGGEQHVEGKAQVVTSRVRSCSARPRRSVSSKVKSHVTSWLVELKTDKSAAMEREDDIKAPLKEEDAVVPKKLINVPRRATPARAWQT